MHASVTQIASSTTDPITRMSANIVSVFIERPRTSMKKNVPTSETGIVTSGMSVARPLCRKSQVMNTTRRKVSTSVSTISRIDMRTNAVGSYETFHFMPSGIMRSIDFIVLSIASTISRALPLPCLKTTTRTPGSPQDEHASE